MTIDKEQYLKETVILLQKKIQSLNKQVENIEREKGLLREENENLLFRVNELRSLVENIEREKGLLREENENLLFRVNELRSLVENIEREKDEINSRLTLIYNTKTWKLNRLYAMLIGDKWLGRKINGILDSIFYYLSAFRIYSQQFGTRQAIKRSFYVIKTKIRMLLLKSKKYKKISIDEILGVKNTKDIIIYTPTLDWNHPLFQRPHHIMKGLARRGFIVIFCTPNVRDALSSDLVSIDKNLYLCKNVDALSVLSGRSDLVLYISHLMNVPLIEKLRPSKVIYDYLDDLDVFSWCGQDIVEMHKRLIFEADLILVTADNLWKEVQQYRKDVLLCPNGVDYWHFAKAQQPGPIPFDFKQKGLTSRPIIGYYGALAEWFDYDLISKAAKNRPDYDFVLIGFDYDGSLHKSDILSLTNVYYFSSKPYNELPLYLRYFDVAVIPFKLSNITHSTSPVKLFEYMSALKPIVATAMQEIKKYSCVLIADNSDEFVQLLDKALELKSDKAYLESLRQEALNNTWDNRIDIIVRWLEQIDFQRAIIEPLQRPR